MTIKHCGHDEEVRRRNSRRALRCLTAFVMLVAFVIFIVWLILRPRKPGFSLQQITVTPINTSTPDIVTGNMRISISSRNPNERIGIYYDRMLTYATYNSQQMTTAAQLLPTYQGHKDTFIWSSALNINGVSVSPDPASPRTTKISIEIYGRVRWKVGMFVSARYHLHVNCPAYITLTIRNGETFLGPLVKNHLQKDCSVDV